MEIVPKMEDNVIIIISYLRRWVGYNLDMIDILFSQHERILGSYIYKFFGKIYYIRSNKKSILFRIAISLSIMDFFLHKKTCPSRTDVLEYIDTLGIHKVCHKFGDVMQNKLKVIDTL